MGRLFVRNHGGIITGGERVCVCRTAVPFAVASAMRFFSRWFRVVSALWEGLPEQPPPPRRPQPGLLIHHVPPSRVAVA